MLKIIETDASSIGKKRQQVSRACDDCRRSKRRCVHAVGSNPLGASERDPLQNGTISTTPAMSSAERPSPGNVSIDRVSFGASPRMNGRWTGETTGFQQQAPNHFVQSSPRRADGNSSSEARQDEYDERSPMNATTSTTAPRFIGDLNPAGVFLAATSPNSTRGESLSESVGLWLQERVSSNGAIFDAQPAESMFHGSSSTITKILLPVLREEASSLLPPSPNLDSLISIYFDTVHRLLPIVDESMFRSLNASDPTRILLSQAMCLVASMSIQSRPYLWLTGSDTLLSNKEFGKRLYSALRTLTEIAYVTDKMILIQVFALMSLFADAAEEGSMSSLSCSKAVHCAQSIGLHVGGSKEGSHVVSLFCCVWALDRINAALNGRPVLMHERDFGRHLTTCFGAQQPIFQLLLRVVMVLDDVIQAYRPSTGHQIGDWNPTLPSFEELMTACDSLTGNTSLLGKALNRQTWISS